MVWKIDRRREKRENIKVAENKFNMIFEGKQPNAHRECARDKQINTIFFGVCIKIRCVEQKGNRCTAMLSMRIV